MNAGRGRPSGLGRGLSSLIPDRAVHATAAGGPVLLRVPIERVTRNPEQPREAFDEADLAALAESIRAHGLLSPLLVRELDGAYVLIAGERRWRAAGRAGLTEIAVLVTDRADHERDSLLLALVENLQRSDLNAVEEALGYQRLVEAHGLSHEEVARSVGRDRSTVTNALRLLRLPPRALEALRAGRISAGHGKALLALDSSEHLPALLAAIEERGLSVRGTEQRVAQLNAAGTPAHEPAPTRYAAAEQLLARQLNAPVQIRAKGKKGGQIVIRYTSEEELVSLVDILSGEGR
ncbi:MAG: ParB/RepB/Spo0J family partition protein [Pseudomonadota bacterium]